MAAQEFTIEELEEEEWRDIPGYEGIYQVSSIGRVKRIKSWMGRPVGYCLKPGTNGIGYLFICLSNGTRSTKKGRRVHSLVAAAFIGPCPDGYQVNHIDAIKTNNRWQNLEYVTPKENMEHAARLGLMSHARGPNPKRQGEKSSAAKLTNRDVVAIRRALLKGVKGTVIAKQYGVTTMTVSGIKVGKSWKYLVEGRDEVCGLGSWQTRRRR